MLVRLGARRGVGFDPALPANRTAVEGDGTVELIATPFDPAAVSGRYAAIACRSVLELVEDPVALLEDMGRTSTTSANCPMYLEVPNAAWILDASRVWNLHFEHRWYFDARSLSRCAARAGLHVVSCEPCYDDGQYLRMIAVPAVAAARRPPRGTTEADHRQKALATSFEREVTAWRQRLARWHRAGRVVVLWGAGGRGTSFLNAVCAQEHISLVASAVDINPDRQGRYIPGTGHAIVPPSALSKIAPSVVLISNGTYGPEIRAHLETLRIPAETVSL
jgi:hypothetical protein